MRLAIDAVTLEVQWSKLISIVDEAEVTLYRTAFSAIVSEAYDFACLLFDGEGRSLVASSRGMPGFITTMPETMRAFLDQFPPASLRPGDVLVTNDPWICAGHLPDFVIASPIFRKERLVGYAASMAHSTDIGGSLNWQGTREMFEEGLRVPVMKMYEGGRRNQALFDLIRANVRVPSEVFGDIEAQLTANSLMASRLQEFLDEYALVGLEDLAATIHQRSENAMREVIGEIPDGVYAYELPIDGLDRPLTIRAVVRVAGSDMTVDYTGSSPQVERGAINVVYNFTFGETAYALKALLLPSLPIAEGFFRPLTVIAPPGCILNARFPAATMSRYNTAAHIDAAISGCLAQAIPDRIMAQTGLQYTSKFYGQWPDGRAFGTMSIVGGGMGALGYKDGLTGTLFPSSASNCSVEVLEQRVPVVALQKEILADSGGAGRWRGGCGQRVAYTLAPGQGTPVTISFSMRMIDHPAYGLVGGRSGGRGAMFLDGRTFTRRDPELIDGCLVLQPGQVLRVDVGGGGGVGDPRERARALVAGDLENEYVSPEAAARDYGLG